MKLKYINDRNVRLRWGPQTLEDEFECLGAYGVSKDATVQVLGRTLGGTGRGMVPEIPDTTRAPAGQPTNESADVVALEEQAGSEGASATSGSASSASTTGFGATTGSAAPPAASSAGVSGASPSLAAEDALSSPAAGAAASASAGAIFFGSKVSSTAAAPFRVGAASAGSLFSRSGGPASGLASASASDPTFNSGASTASVSLNGTDVHVMLLSWR